MPKPHFLLVHGAYHRAWHLRHLKTKLEEAGYPVSSIELPAAGDTSKDHIDDGLAADTLAIKMALEDIAKTPDGIVPLFHSYAGIPGSEAAAEVNRHTAEKIERMIYLAAFVLPQGQALTPKDDVKLAPWAALTADEKFGYVPKPIEPFYADVDSAIAREAADHVVQHALSSFTTPTKHQGWELFPTTYIFCTQDQALPHFMQEAWFEKMTPEERDGWSFESIESGHSPFLSKPDELARVIISIAES